MEELIGEVQDIIYQNETNGYTIAVLETDKEEITIVGYLPFVTNGDTLKVRGNYVEHKDYGTQFKIITFEKTMPKDEVSIRKYLASGKIKGVGEVTAKNIVKKFGANTINIIKYDPIKLTEIRGISEEKAQIISEAFIENQEMWKIVSFLERFNIGAEHAKKVYEMLGIDSVRKIEENPYILIEITRGVDFKQIDQMAIKMGIELENKKRVQSGIKYGLIKATYNGHSCILQTNLIEYVRTLLNINTEVIEDNIINLKAKEEIKVVKRNGEKWVYLINFYNTEQEIAFRIKELQKSKNTKEITNIELELKKLQNNSQIELSEKQKEAIKEINKNNILIITGGPGTGKTTIIKTIIDIYEKRGKKVVLSAPTGRAAKKMTEATGKEASTLHRL